MTHERTLEMLDDFVGGELPLREEREVRRHLMQCESCRAEEQALRALLDLAASLPDEVMPERDLWQDIAPRLEARTGRAQPQPDETPPEVRVIGPRPVRPLPWWLLAAASVALVVTTSLVTLRLAPRGGADQPVVLPTQVAQAPQGAAGQPSAGQPSADRTAPAAGGTPTALAAFRPAEREYEKAIADLQAALDTRRGELAPQTVATLEANLKIIDQAIRESREALAADPNRPELARMLSAAYDTKLDVLRRAVTL